LIIKKESALTQQNSTPSQSIYWFHE